MNIWLFQSQQSLYATACQQPLAWTTNCLPEFSGAGGVSPDVVAVHDVPNYQFSRIDDGCQSNGFDRLNCQQAGGGVLHASAGQLQAAVGQNIYEPEFSPSENPHYYHVNEILFRAHVDRMLRYHTGQDQ